MNARLPRVLRQRLIAMLAFALVMAGGGQGLISASAFAAAAFGRPGVNWHALATDGHKTSGAYMVTVKP